jgi:hypothetical protein
MDEVLSPVDAIACKLRAAFASEIDRTHPHRVAVIVMVFNF